MIVPPLNLDVVSVGSQGKDMKVSGRIQVAQRQPQHRNQVTGSGGSPSWSPTEVDQLYRDSNTSRSFQRI